MKSYNYIIFDLDGTITDSEEGIINSIQYSLKKLGIIERDYERLKQFIGPPLKDSFIKTYLLDNYSAAKAIEYYREYYSSTGIFQNRLYDGITDLLKNLRDRGKSLFIATAKPRFYLEKILKYFSIDGFFEYYSGSNLDGSLTDKGELINKVLAKLGSGREGRAVMVGDTKYDILGAKKNFIDSIAVTYGYGNRDELIQNRPEYVVGNIHELKKVLLR